jgi:hypothetical protein
MAFTNWLVFYQEHSLHGQADLLGARRGRQLALNQTAAVDSRSEQVNQP